MSKKCVKCGIDLEDVAVFCDECGAKQPTQDSVVPKQQNKQKEQKQVGVKKRITAGLLGIFLGGFGIHNFYLGFNVKGIIQLLLSVFLFGTGALWGFVEGILILIKKINTDAKGAELQ